MGDYILAFFVGAVVMGLIFSISLAAGAPVILLGMAFAVMVAAMIGFVCYQAGKRGKKYSSAEAYNRGFDYGRKLGRAEGQSEIQDFLKEDE